MRLQTPFVKFEGFVVCLAVLVGCSSHEGSAPVAMPSVGGSSGVGGSPSAGSQTGGEGTSPPCTTLSTTDVDQDTARALGFPVDDHLSLFDRTIEVPFHRGTVDCARLPPSADGRVQVLAALQGIAHEKLVPTFPEFPEVCPDWKHDRLIYRAIIEIETDEGSLAGSIDGRAWAEHPVPGTEGYAGFVFSVDSEPGSFAGSLGIRVDPSRPREGWVGGMVAIGAPAFASQLTTGVNYTDSKVPEGDQGDGMFWPFDAVERGAFCGWLDIEGAQRDFISIDDYNRL